MRLTSAALTAAFAALFTAVAPAAVAEPSAAPAATPPGRICFWTQPGMMGQSWCYGPPGYAEAENGTQRNAHSFESRYNGSVYAISYGSGSSCVYREIRTDDYDEDWSWAGKLDGVSHETMGCEPG
ncbi:hypothetical protein ACIBKX_03505 [Streptomyces sp. NPDC050658]|uniref:hypothetical protein n=1 Tax=unclassified Streptomyces TaxID=2593676 RepID=UPI00343CF797